MVPFPRCLSTLKPILLLTNNVDDKAVTLFASSVSGKSLRPSRHGTANTQSGILLWWMTHSHRLWCPYSGEKAALNLPVDTVIFLRSVKVSNYNGRCLEVNDKSFVDINPRDSGAHRVWAWYQGGKHQQLRSMTTAANLAGKSETLQRHVCLTVGCCRRSPGSTTATYEYSSCDCNGDSGKYPPYYWAARLRSG